MVAEHVSHVVARLESLCRMLADPTEDVDMILSAVSELATTLKASAPHWTAEDRDEVQGALSAVTEVASARRQACLQALQEQGAGRRASASYGETGRASASPGR